jgi:GTP cyclohydrolase I
MIDNGLSDGEKILKLTELFTEVLETLGMDLTNDSLRDSPGRIARMYVYEIFRGLNIDNFPKITAIENEMSYDQMLVVRDISVISTCEHHFVTIDGLATIAYIPKDKVIGLSKINRIADFFARRPQVQERLTKQIADCLEDVLGTEDVAVHINAKHYCVISRGIEDHSSTTITSDLRGAFKEDSRTRSEFLLHCAIKI